MVYGLSITGLRTVKQLYTDCQTVVDGLSNSGLRFIKHIVPFRRFALCESYPYQVFIATCRHIYA